MNLPSLQEKLGARKKYFPPGFIGNGKKSPMCSPVYFLLFKSKIRPPGSMSTSKRRAVDDVSEQGEASSLPGASTLSHADITRADGPCPKTSCACPGEFHSSAPPAAPEAERSCKAQKNSCAQDVEQDMEKQEMDIAHTTQTVRYHHCELCMRAL